MNKQQLIEHISEECDIKKSLAETILNTITNTIAIEMIDGSKVTIRGFGRFSRQTRKARTGCNPQTGEPMQIPEQNIVQFKPSKSLNDLLN